MSVLSAPGTRCWCQWIYVNWLPALLWHIEGQILCLLLPCEYCMPRMLNFWYLHIYCSVLCSNKIHCGTKTRHKRKTLLMNWPFKYLPRFDPCTWCYMRFWQTGCLSHSPFVITAKWFHCISERDFWRRLQTSCRARDGGHLLKWREKCCSGRWLKRCRRWQAVCQGRHGLRRRTEPTSGLWNYSCFHWESQCNRSSRIALVYSFYQKNHSQIIDQLWFSIPSGN